MANSAERGHSATNHSTDPGMTAAGQASVIRQGFCESHADTGAHRGGHSHEKGVPTVSGRKGRSENRSKSGNGPIHETGKTRLYDLQNKQPSTGLVFVFLDLGPQLLLAELLRPILMGAFLLGQIVQQLPDTSILGTDRRCLIKSAGFNFHG